MTLTDSGGLLLFRDTVSAALDEIARPRKDLLSWDERANEAASALPVEVRLTGSLAGTFLKWKVGYDESISAGPFLSLLAAVGQSVIGHWWGAVGSLGKAGSKYYELQRSYETFLASDESFAACAKIMVAYNAEIFSTSLIILGRATAAWRSDGHGGSYEFGGRITDRR